MRRPYASRYFIHPGCYTEFSISKNGIASTVEGSNDMLFPGGEKGEI